MRSTLLLALAAATPALAPAPKRSQFCVDKFQTAEDWANFRWDAVTDLGQATNTLQVSASGAVRPEDAAAWPMRDLIAAAHGNSTRITATLHPASKADAAAFLSQPSPRCPPPRRRPRSWSFLRGTTGCSWTGKGCSRSRSAAWRALSASAAPLSGGRPPRQGGLPPTSQSPCTCPSW